MSETPALSPEEISELVAQQSRARDVFLDGWARGYAAGQAAAQLDQEEWADMLVRRQRALEYLDTEVRKVAVSAADWIDVHKARTAPHSPYVPRHGDIRYGRTAA